MNLILALFIFSTLPITFVTCRIKTKYTADRNQLIKRLHGSTHAKLFLYGCVSDPYIELAANETSESKVFKLQKSTEHLLAIFTLQQVSLLISSYNYTNGTIKDIEKQVTFNITIGSNKNSEATLEVLTNNETATVGNNTANHVPELPTIPYYVRVSIKENNMSVFEARSDAIEPFLFVNKSIMAFPTDQYYVRFEHSSPIFAHYDCCENCSSWIYTRISGCSKYSAKTANIKSETTHFLTCDDNSQNKAEHHLFSQNIVINHDGSRIFAAKIIFSEHNSLSRNRYEIVLSETPTIFHYFNGTSKNETLQPEVTLKRNYVTPFIVNITITAGGKVTLQQPYEDLPFLVYNSRKQQNFEPVNVKYMSMLKVHEDFVRYDFYYNCTDVLSFADSDDRTDHDSELYPTIREYVSKRFGVLKYDVLHIFQDSYQVYEKSLAVVNAENNANEDNELSDSSNTSKENTNESTTNKSNFPDFLKKGLAGIGSFFFIGILKLVCSLDCVKNIMKEVNADEVETKDMRKKFASVLSTNIVGEINDD